MAKAITTAALGGQETSDANYMSSGTKKKAKKAPAAPVKLPPNPFVFEILEAANKQRSADKKAEILRDHRNEALVSILIWNFDETAVSMIPDGPVPYERNEVPVGTDHTSLRKEYRNLYNFVKGGNDSLSAVRRETMFIQMLEGLHPKEADILCLVKDGNLSRQYPKINKDVVSKAYPDIVWGDRL